MAMAQEGKPELTKFKAFVLLQNSTASCSHFPEGVQVAYSAALAFDFLWSNW